MIIPSNVTPVEMESLEFSTLQRLVCDWAKEKFPDQTLAGKEAHLRKELQELLDSDLKDVTEMADCVLLMLQLADAQDKKLLLEVFAKFKINRERTWAPADADGVHSHVKEPVRRHGLEF